MKMALITVAKTGEDAELVANFLRKLFTDIPFEVKGPLIGCPEDKIPFESNKLQVLMGTSLLLNAAIDYSRHT